MISGCEFDPIEYAVSVFGSLEDYKKLSRREKIDFWKDVKQKICPDIDIGETILRVFCPSLECSDTYGAFHTTFCHGYEEERVYNIDDLSYVTMERKEVVS